MTTDQADERTRERAIETVEGLQEHAAQLAALASALGDQRATTAEEAYRLDSLRAAVLDRLPVDPVALLAGAWPQRAPLSGALASRLGQAAAAAGNAVPAWSAQRDEVIVAQGEASAMTGRALAERVVPGCADLAERLAAGGAILDVGTGIGAVAVALAEAFGQASVTGIDIAPRPLEIARERLDHSADAGVRARVAYREQDVLALPDEPVYDLAWLPAPFLPAAILDDALRRVMAAVRAGGWIVVGTNSDRPGGPPPGAAWLAALAGGSAETASQAEARLQALDAASVQRFPTVPGGPVLVAGRVA
jgi:predicted O-methyltransferase YrrM